MGDPELIYVYIGNVLSASFAQEIMSSSPILLKVKGKKCKLPTALPMNGEQSAGRVSWP